MAFADLVLIDHASGLAPGDLRKFSYALGDQLRDHVAPVWGRYVVPWVGAPSGTFAPRTWKLHFWSTPRAAQEKGAYGYHTTDGPDHVPVGHVFTELIRRAGEEWTVIASHEALEMVADEWVNLEVSRRGPDGVWELWPREICLAGDTLVDLADGTQRPIRELAEEGRPFQVRTVQSDGGRGTASGVAWQTACSASVVQVRLTDGRSVTCTAYHQFMLADGSYKAAARLSPGDRLYSDVAPRKTLPDLANRRVVYAVAQRQRDNRLRTGADLQHLTFRQLTGPDCLASLAPIPRHSLLSGGVEHVLVMRSEEEVVRTHASWRVATVAHLGAFGDIPEGPGVREAVHVVDPPTLSNLSVPRRTQRAGPQPTGVRLLDARPEPVLERGGSTVVHSVAGSGRVRGARAPKTSVVKAAQALRPVGAGAAYDCAWAGHGPVVDAVQAVGKADVYDIHVPETHNFSVAGGVYVHNCDPCQGLSYDIVGVKVSDFVYPEWFIPGSDGPFDHMRRLSRPFEIHESGYAAVRRINGGRITNRNVYGAAYPSWRKKRRAMSRKARRV